MINNLKRIFEDKPKTAFYASDVNKPLLDLYFSFKGVEKTNPPKWFETLKWGAGKGVEEALLQVLKDSDVVPKDYNQEQHGRINIQREGVEIHGYIDAITNEGDPVEIKSINNANYFDVKRYKEGLPRENYVGQLAIYMDALSREHGYLFVASVDGLQRFVFDCNKIGDGIYKCGNVTVDIKEQYKKWAQFKKENLDTDTMPNLFEYRYKHKLSDISWDDISDKSIENARMNRAVIGDYQVGWSSWKNKIVELQGETLGYTEDEIKFIKEKTAGYKSKK